MVRQALRRANGKGMVAIGGVGAAGVKEVLDWLWDVGLQDPYPILYEFIHLEAVDAGIMAMVAGFWIWLARRAK